MPAMIARLTLGQRLGHGTLKAGKVRDNVRHVLLEEQHPKHQSANPDHVERHSPPGEKILPLLQLDLNPRDRV